MSERRGMEVGDWFNAAINVVIGVLLGSLIYRLVQLVASGSWLMALIFPTITAGHRSRGLTRGMAWVNIPFMHFFWTKGSNPPQANLAGLFVMFRILWFCCLYPASFHCTKAETM